jgi:hypothetical protein
MNMHDLPLVTIRCHANHATVQALVGRYGLRAQCSGDQHQFDILRDGRGSESELDRELAQMALNDMREAVRDGALPTWYVVKMR